jgi:hypothetical protein
MSVYVDKITLDKENLIYQEHISSLNKRILDLSRDKYADKHLIHLLKEELKKAYNKINKNIEVYKPSGINFAKLNDILLKGMKLTDAEIKNIRDTNEKEINDFMKTLT